MVSLLRGFVLSAAMVSGLALADGYAVAGAAYNVKSGQLVYRELFSRMDDNKEVHVTYAKADGVTFARKTLNYNSDVFQPGVNYTDDRDDETVSATFDVGRLVMTHRVKGDSVTKTLFDTARLVIDAGLDAYIQQQWGKLTAGERVELEMANPRTVATEKFIIREIDAAASPLAYKGAGQTWKYFKMDSNNKVVISSILGTPTYFAYDPEGKYLMRYQGRSNIDSDAGQAWDVRIEYEYF